MNTELAEKYIVDSGKTRVFIAKKLGISPQSLYNKLHNIYDWTITEADVFCREVGVTDAEAKKELFLTPKVDNKRLQKGSA